MPERQAAHGKQGSSRQAGRRNLSAKTVSNDKLGPSLAQTRSYTYLLLQTQNLPPSSFLQQPKQSDVALDNTLVEDEKFQQIVGSFFVRMLPVLVDKLIH
jgi:hypothetical protein